MSSREPTIPVPGCLPTALVGFVSTVLGALIIAVALAFLRTRLCLGAQQLTFVAYGVPSISAVVFSALLIRATRRPFAALIRGAILFVILFGVFAMNLRSMRASLDATKQSLTQERMRAIAAELEHYRAKQRHYPVAESIAAVEQAVGSDIETRDAWGNAFRLWSNHGGYRLVSCGACGDLDVPRGVAIDSRSVIDPRDDLVLENGKFVRWGE